MDNGIQIAVGKHFFSFILAGTYTAVTVEGASGFRRLSEAKKWLKAHGYKLDKTVGIYFRN